MTINGTNGVFVNNGAVMIYFVTALFLIQKGMTSMLLSIFVTLFALIALFEGCYFLTHLNKPFMIFDPVKSPFVHRQLQIWGIIMTILGLITLVAAWTNSIAFIVIMVVLGCILETQMAFSITSEFRAKNR